MKIFSIFIVVLLSLTFFVPLSGLAAQQESNKTKPLPPLTVTIRPVQQGLLPSDIKPGDVVQFTVSAMSSIDASELQIDVELTGGARLIAGDLSWRGPAKKNEQQTLTITVSAPDKGKGGIRARVSIPPSGGARFSAAAHYMMGPEVKSKPEEHPVKKDSRGRNVIEYR